MGKISYIKITISFLLIFILFSFASCGLNSQYSTNLFAMDTSMTITAYGENSEIAINAVEKEINQLDKLLSIEKSKSEIFELNSEKTLEVSEDTLNIISKAYEISELTDGDFDITISPIVSEWGFYSNLDNKVPSKNELEDVLEYVDYKNIKIENNKITLDKNSSVDLGGIAKGYASNKSAEILKSYGIKSALISLGGNISVVGSKPDGSDWIVAIANPDDNSSSVGYLSVTDTAVITSGGYQRYFEDNGQIYHHIIDPKTGYPADSGLKSVTIVSSDDTLADALSTALFVKDLDKSIEFYKEHKDLFGAIFITDENKIYITPDLESKFSSDLKYEVIDA